MITTGHGDRDCHTTRVRLSFVEKILLTESGTRRNSNWTNYRQIFLGRQVERANFNYVFIDRFSVKVSFLKK